MPLILVNLMQKQINITVDVEEWFHSNWFDVSNILDKYSDGEYPDTDVKNTTKKLVDTFNKYEVKATFFVLGETAHKYPEIIEILKNSEHEIGCHSWYHNKKYGLKEFKEDILRFKNEVYSDVNGFRFPNFEYSNQKLKILVEEGFNYDSSIVPCLKIPGWYGNHKSPITPYDLHIEEKMYIKEFPISVIPYLRLPGAGGWFLRNFGYQWTKNIVNLSLKSTGYGMIYIHPWEISDLNPKIKGIPFHVFRNSGQKTLTNLEKLINDFSNFEFLTLSESLNKMK